jgi:hypothetical protein
VPSLEETESVTKILLCLHVLVAIVAVGPVAVAASRFPPVLRAAAAEDGTAVASLRTLYRICRTYALVGVAVPVLGLATAGVMHVTGDTWVLVSIGLTAIAAAVLALHVLPRQRAALAAIETRSEIDPGAAARIAMLTGIFNVLWVAVTVLMIVRPGSSAVA